MYLLESDKYGRWTGVREGESWTYLHGSDRPGVYETAIVRLYPPGAFWAVCFRPSDPVVDVDIILPAEWTDSAVEEVDLELDVIGLADGTVHVRDLDEFERVQRAYDMPADLATRAQETCEWVRESVSRGDEPFRSAGMERLTRFMASK